MSFPIPAREVTTPQDFNAVADGVSDDTAPMLSWRDAVMDGVVGYLPTGRYKIDEGTLVFSNGSENSNGPIIITDGSFNSIIVAAGKYDVPLMEIRNDTPGRVFNGARIDGIGFCDTSGDDAPNRCGLALSGLSYSTFGYIRGEGLRSDLVRIPVRNTNGNPDPFHVFACSFEGIQLVNSVGWALNNANGVGFNGCNVFGVEATKNEKGAIRSGGAGNRYHVVTCGETKGWAIERYFPDATVSRETYDMLELHAPENGILLSAMELFEIKRARIIYSWISEENFYWPRVGFKINGAQGGAINGGYIELIHRIDPGGVEEGLGLLHDFSNDPNITDLHITSWIVDHPGFGLLPPNLGPPIFDNLNPLAKISMKINGNQLLP